MIGRDVPDEELRRLAADWGFDPDDPAALDAAAGSAIFQWAVLAGNVRTLRHQLAAPLRRLAAWGAR